MLLHTQCTKALGFVMWIRHSETERSLRQHLVLDENGIPILTISSAMRLIGSEYEHECVEVVYARLSVSSDDHTESLSH